MKTSDEVFKWIVRLIILFIALFILRITWNTWEHSERLQLEDKNMIYRIDDPERGIIEIEAIPQG